MYCCNSDCYICSVTVKLSKLAFRHTSGIMVRIIQQLSDKYDFLEVFGFVNSFSSRFNCHAMIRVKALLIRADRVSPAPLAPFARASNVKWTRRCTSQRYCSCLSQRTSDYFVVDADCCLQAWVACPGRTGYNLPFRESAVSWTSSLIYLLKKYFPLNRNYICQILA